MGVVALLAKRARAGLGLLLTILVLAAGTTAIIAGTLGYSERLLVEKWARDSKILDIFEGTQQIQLLIIARQLLKKTSAELK